MSVHDADPSDGCQVSDLNFPKHSEDSNYLCFVTPLNLNHPDTSKDLAEEGVFQHFQFELWNITKMDALIQTNGLSLTYCPIHRC